MRLLEIVHRQKPPGPWTEGDKIPWNDPGFSQRMLVEHLSQAHDAASRRFATIDRQVAWIHETVLRSKTTRILDLACGPGLYMQRLAGLGHSCTGIDFSPASIAHARAQAARSSLDCTYLLDDLRTARFGEDFGLVMLIYGEINVFPRSEARAILARAFHALSGGGTLLLEPHSFETVVALGEEPPAWYSAEKGLFLASPHLCLQENFWDAEQRAAIERYYILDALTGEVTRHSSSTQAYTEQEYRSLLGECGFASVVFHPSLEGEAGERTGGFPAVLARKGQADRRVRAG